jgi:predicted N-acetyltransferase YhbS
MRISYLADRPELAAQLIPGLLEHWSYVFPHQTAAERAAKFKAHLNHDELPIAWVAHDGDIALGTAALRKVDLEGREDLGPWLGGVFVLPSHRGCGIGSSLCEVVEGKAHAQGVSRLYLFTHGQERLYERLGWTTHEQTMWHGHTSSIMSKVPVPCNKSLERTHEE